MKRERDQGKEKIIFEDIIAKNFSNSLVLMKI